MALTLRLKVLNSELIVPELPPDVPGVLPAVLPPLPGVCPDGLPDVWVVSNPSPTSSGAGCSCPSLSWAGMLRKPLAVLTKCGRKRCGMKRCRCDDRPDGPVVEGPLVLLLLLPPSLLPLLWYASMY
uniref:Uncharacterized protein n=1 Tax=Anopheles culicifacies TaxID=139723 RepID=A0A182MIU6_9DIPT